mmetsp:Transcript_77511/g.250909  ORF Transcript_77511/g.250909 Transcript_77511/m.250909 type:complete len:959 (+) Transcript_77511:177-3053(+)
MESPGAVSLRASPVDAASPKAIFKRKILSGNTRAMELHHMQVSHAFAPSSTSPASPTPPALCPPRRGGRPVIGSGKDAGVSFPPIPGASRDGIGGASVDGTTSGGACGSTSLPPTPRPPSPRILSGQHSAEQYKPWHLRAIGLPSQPPLESTRGMPFPRPGSTHSTYEEEDEGLRAEMLVAATAELLAAVAKHSRMQQHDQSARSSSFGPRYGGGIGLGGPSGRARAVLWRGCRNADVAAAAVAEVVFQDDESLQKLCLAREVLVSAQLEQAEVIQQMRGERLHEQRVRAATEIQSACRAKVGRDRARRRKAELKRPAHEEEERLWRELRAPRVVRSLATFDRELASFREAEAELAAQQAAQRLAEKRAMLDAANCITVALAVEGFDEERLQTHEDGGRIMQGFRRALECGIAMAAGDEVRPQDVHLQLPWDSLGGLQVVVVPHMGVDLQDMADILGSCLSVFEQTIVEQLGGVPDLFECAFGSIAVEVLCVNPSSVQGVVRPPDVGERKDGAKERGGLSHIMALVGPRPGLDADDETTGSTSRIHSVVSDAYEDEDLLLDDEGRGILTQTAASEGSPAAADSGQPSPQGGGQHVPQLPEEQERPEEEEKAGGWLSDADAREDVDDEDVIHAPPELASPPKPGRPTTALAREAPKAEQRQRSPPRRELPPVPTFESEAVDSLRKLFADLKEGRKDGALLSGVAQTVRERYVESCKHWQVKPNSLALSRIEATKVSSGADGLFETAYDFSMCHIGDRGAVCLLHALAYDAQCVSVSLASCGLRRACALTLGAFIELHPRLNNLDLQQNNLSFDSGESFLASLQHRLNSSREQSLRNSSREQALRIAVQPSLGSSTMMKHQFTTKRQFTNSPRPPEHRGLRVNLGGTPLAWDRSGCTVGPPAGSLWAGKGETSARLAPSRYEALRQALDETARFTYARSDSRSPSPSSSPRKRKSVAAQR